MTRHLNHFCKEVTFKQNKEHAKFTTGEDICKPSNKPSAGYKEGNVPSLRPHLLDYTRDGRLCTIIFPNNTIYWNNQHESIKETLNTSSFDASSIRIDL